MKNSSPPKGLFRLLFWFCPEQLYEEIEGDLIQKFNKDVKELGIAKARRRLIWNTIRFIRPGIVLRRATTKINRGDMIISNIQFSLRHLQRQKMNTFIHLFGLSIGISACLLIGLFIHHELSFDSYHPDPGHTFRVNTVMKESEKQFDLWATPAPLGQALKKDLPGIKYLAQVFPQYNSAIEINGDKHLKQEHILIAEPEFLDIFKVEVIAGNGWEALHKPYQAILSESTAKKFYGNDYPIGKTFRYRNEFEITVAGLMRDLPSNTSLPANILLSFSDNQKFLDNGDIWYFGNFSWVKFQASTFIVLDEQAKVDAIAKQLNVVAAKNINASPQLDKVLRGSFELQPLSTIHLNDERFGGGPWVKAISPTWLWLFGSIGIIVITLACINFLNLSVAQGITRTKEVTVRKIIGARKSQLIGQFLIEACLLTVVAGILSLMVAKLSIAPLNLLLNASLTFEPIQSSLVLILFFLALLLLGMLAGFYPSLLIARFKPGNLLKSAKNFARTSLLQQSLVVTQFTVSITLTIVVLLIARQVNFMQSKDLGLEKENILQVRVGEGTSAEAFVNQLKGTTGIKEVSLSRSAPISNDHWWNTISKDETSERQSVCAIHADENFFSVYDLKLISGQYPSRSTIGDTLLSRVVVNEKLLESLNLGDPQQVIGKQFWWGGPTEITGVVANFNSEPLHYEISPVLITHDPTVYAQANIRLEQIQTESVLNEIEEVWKKSFPDQVYESKFLTEEIETFYKIESKFYSLLLVFAALAICISCMGLWGIASFVTLRRVKEVSVRKVLGANVLTVVSLFLRQFLKPVLAASLLSLPFSFYVINRILENYAYRTTITGDLFLFPVCVLMIISVLTVGIHTMKASLTNPVDNLRSE